ncbi:MAG: hypothetical protein KC457_35405, partial [Myxococcales bacterium]|nr:hypothetical protein [Myxococcales bacterium]
HPPSSPLGDTPKLGPVFELRNMIPHLGSSDRFPSSEWVAVGMAIAELLENLNIRTDEEAMTDLKVDFSGSMEEEDASWKT